MKRRARLGWLTLRPGDGGLVGIDTDNGGHLLVEVAPHEFEDRPLPDPVPPAASRHGVGVTPRGSKPARPRRRR